jgi:3-hydroxypropanoate dehydrogenase
LLSGFLVCSRRAVGIDCGPMPGSDAAKVNAQFFPDGKWNANFLIKLRYGDPGKLHPRNPRLAFEEAIKVL